MATNLRKRAKVDYKEPRESDITLLTCPEEEYFPIKVVEEDSSRYTVHYLGYSTKYDEWKEKGEVVDIDESDHENPQSVDIHFSLYNELAIRIKAALNSSRKGSPGRSSYRSAI